MRARARADVECVFFPDIREPEKVLRPEVEKKKAAAAVPAWLRKWAGGEPDDEDDHASQSNRLGATPLDSDQHYVIAVEAADPPRPVKRRLKRAISDFDKDTNTHLERNHQRTCLTLTYVRPMNHFTHGVCYVVKNRQLCRRYIVPA